MQRILAILLCSLLTISATAQEKPQKKSSGKSIGITTDGIHVNTNSDDSTEKGVELVVGLDLGINTLRDKTNYSSAATQQFLQVSNELKNENLFSLRNGKSINVNIYPVMAKCRLVKTSNQRIYLSTGLGLQLYNFTFNRPISYLNQTTPTLITDSVAFTKNKLSFNYLMVPLMFTFKTRLADKLWLVYGVGISEGYRLDSWTKQVSGERGKQKNHDRFNFADFNTCITGEIGIQDYFRLYASYQVTSLASYGLDQHPFAIGLRFLGI